MNNLIASPLGLPTINSGIEARRAVEDGHFLLREDDVRAAVAAERAKRDRLLAALKDARVPAAAEAYRRQDGLRDEEAVERLARIDAAIAAAEAAP